MNQAVISGVNLYRESPYDSLRGCVEDAQNLNLLAVNYLDFTPAHIFLQLDSQAVAADIKLRVRMAVNQAGPGDHILWTHSSHGTNNPDPTQKDGLQELLCCYDTREKDGLWDMDTVISAKFIGEVIAKLHPQAHMDILIDACYAPEGGQLKLFSRNYSKARFLWKDFVSNTRVGGTGQSKMPPNVCLWSACEPTQTSADAYIDNHWQGAFTAAFRKFFKIGRSRSDIIYYARNWLKDNRYAQTPHLYGRSGMTDLAVATK